MKLFLVSLVLILGGCSRITVLRTSEVDALVEERLSLQTDSLNALYREGITSLKEEMQDSRFRQEEQLRRLEDQIRRLLTSMEENNLRITSIMEQTGAVSRHLEERARRDSLAQAQAENERQRLFRDAKSNFRQGNFQSALDGFEEYRERYDDSAPEYSDALFWSGESHYALDQLNEAEEIYMHYFRNYSEKSHAASVLYKLGLIYGRRNQNERRDRVWDQLVDRYPDSQEAKRAEALR